MATVQVELDLIDNITKNIGAVNASVTRNLERMERAAQKTGKQFGEMSAPITAAQAAFAGLSAIAGGALVRSFVQAGNEFEGLTTQFKVLLGSADEAKKRIQEYAEFGAKTPFELGEIARAGRVLQTFGGSLLATGENLKMVGDIAAGTNTPFENTAMWIGRMYDALQSGRPWGEAGMRLQEMGALSGAVRARLEGMQEAGASGAVIWSEFSKEMGRFNGMMDELSATVAGKWSTTQDLLKQGMREILAGGGWDSLSEGITDFNTALQKLIDSGALKNFGENLSTLLTVGRDFALLWAGGKVATGINSFVIASRNAATASAGWRAALGPLTLAVGALGIGLDALIEKQAKLADKKADMAWFTDADKIAKIRSALASWQVEHAKTVQQAQSGARVFNSDDKTYSDRVKELTGFTAAEFANLWNERALATREGILRQKAIIDAANSGGGSSPTQTAPAGESKFDAFAAIDAMDQAHRQTLEFTMRAEGEITQIKAEALAQREIDKRASDEKEAAAWLKELELKKSATRAELAMDDQIRQSKFAVADAMAGAIGQIEGAQMAGFVLQKAIAAGLIISNSLAAQAASLAPPPIGLGPVFGMGLAAKIKVNTMLQLAALAATSVGQAAKMESGGMIYGPRHSGGGVPINAEGGEFVLSRRDVSNLGGPSGVEAMRRGASSSGQGQSVNISYAPQVQIQSPQKQLTPTEVATMVAQALEHGHRDLFRQIQKIDAIGAFY